MLGIVQDVDGRMGGQSYRFGAICPGSGHRWGGEGKRERVVQSMDIRTLTYVHRLGRIGRVGRITYVQILYSLRLRGASGPVGPGPCRGGPACQFVRSN